MPKEQTIHLGYEVGAGEPIRVPLRHMAVTGQTQQSGKTTTLEALIGRAGGTALTFVTKRGERSFESGRRIAPYFRDRADWQFVTSILDATLQEKNKFLRPWIMKICRDTHTLREVQKAVQIALRTAKGINEGVYTQLDAYLDLIVPEIDRADLAETLELGPGVNVMDLIEFSMPMQMLFIQSALDWVNDRARNTTVVIPEAWEFVPEGKGSPVKASAIALARKGAAIGNHVWLDSQDMAGVDKTLLRACTVWLIGVQREPNEIKRNLLSIPAGLKRPKPEDIASLERGQFFACFGKTTVKVYVQPAWMDEDAASAIALGDASVDEVAPRLQQKPTQEDEVDHATARALTEENARLKADAAAAERRGYELGTEAALRQAGEFWNAAALDMRDAAKKVTELGEHLAGVARDGRWSLPRGAAKPVPAKNDVPGFVAGLEEIGRSDAGAAPARDPAPAPADGEQAADRGRAPAEPSMVLIDTLVRSYPLPLTAELWGAFAKKSPTSGWFRGQMKILRDGGFIVSDGGKTLPTAHALRSSSVTPENPKDEAALWGIWRDIIAEDVGGAELAHLEVLERHRPHFLTAEQWGLLTGKSTTSGWWRGAMAKFRAWDLIDVEGVRYRASAKGAAVLGDVAKAPVETARAIQLARYKAMAGGGQQLFDLLKAGDDRKTLIGRAGWNPTSGHARGAIAALLASGLVEDRAGALLHAKEKLA